MHIVRWKDSLEAQNHAVGRTRGVDRSTVNANAKHSYSWGICQRKRNIQQRNDMYRHTHL
jgi:hypothetical protein